MKGHNFCYNFVKVDRQQSLPSLVNCIKAYTKFCQIPSDNSFSRVLHLCRLLSAFVVPCLYSAYLLYLYHKFQASGLSMKQANLSRTWWEYTMTVFLARRLLLTHCILGNFSCFFVVC